MLDSFISPERHHALAAILSAQRAAFPEHDGYLERRFKGADERDLAFLEQLSALILQLTGERLSDVCLDYRWLAGAVLDEEIFFRREGRYRLSSFAEAEATIYADHVLMTRYMNGLLLTQLWWKNHTDVLRWYCESFLPLAPPGANHLEIGPGHGLFLYLASLAPQVASVTGWDVSQASLDLVARNFAVLAAPKTPELFLVNLFGQAPRTFDSVVFSEVLEHLEQPAKALEALAKVVAPGGRVFVNAPVNSPAPDHITLFRTPEEIVDLVMSAGFEIEATLFAPTSGVSLERARNRSLAISTAVIARNRAD